MAETIVDLQALLHICVTEMAELGLRFNAKKTKAVPFAGNMAEAADLKLGGADAAAGNCEARLDHPTGSAVDDFA
ncbi:hypothetical protein MRX96_018872 [Rhipicephalus microplus]